VVTSLCKVLQHILNLGNSKHVRKLFVFACVWTIGGAFAEIDGIDYRLLFSDWIKNKFKDLGIYEDTGTCFDKNMDLVDCNPTEWTSFNIESDQYILIPTPD
jgi:hypothetical protein